MPCKETYVSRGCVVTHYHILGEKPSLKLVELNIMTTDSKFTDIIGNNNQYIIPEG